jgi:hypothetical protein
MTAPFAPPLPWEVKAIVLGLLAFIIATPHARRDDWVGWIALSTLYAVLFGMWALVIRRWWRA